MDAIGYQRTICRLVVWSTVNREIYQLNQLEAWPCTCEFIHYLSDTHTHIGIQPTKKHWDFVSKHACGYTIWISAMMFGCLSHWIMTIFNLQASRFFLTSSRVCQKVYKLMVLLDMLRRWALVDDLILSDLSASISYQRRRGFVWRCNVSGSPRCYCCSVWVSHCRDSCWWSRENCAEGCGPLRWVGELGWSGDVNKASKVLTVFD